MDYTSFSTVKLNAPSVFSSSNSDTLPSCLNCHRWTRALAISGSRGNARTKLEGLTVRIEIIVHPSPANPRNKVFSILQWSLQKTIYSGTILSWLT